MSNGSVFVLEALEQLTDFRGNSLSLEYLGEYITAYPDKYFIFTTQSYEEDDLVGEGVTYVMNQHVNEITILKEV